jgi:glycosyltransferase involved in cell wall biosynthesis
VAIRAQPSRAFASNAPADPEDAKEASLSAHRPSLSIVIPAYNEEDAIAAIIERTLAARPFIADAAGLSAVEVIVVSDGSSDRTAQIAGQYDEALLIAYEKNRGYGAAIKQGFEVASGDLLAFLDADGTCDPRFFVQLCNAMANEDADVVLGARLGEESEMPRLRRLGNRAYAALINAWGGTNITDSASGMRVIRRSSLPRLYPLPDGMHFTPAMSSRAIFDPRLRIVEVPMPYRERTGESKLSVLRDGLRFLRIIVDTALTYRPLRFFGAAGVILLLIALAYGLTPAAHYVTDRRIEDWMIYRLVAVMVAVVTGVALIAVGLLAQQTVALIHEDFAPPRARHRLLHRTLLENLIPWGVVATLGGVALNGRSLVEYATTGQVTAHWIYVLTGGLLVMLGIEFLCFGVLARVLNILAARKRYAAHLASPAAVPR